MNGKVWTQEEIDVLSRMYIRITLQREKCDGYMTERGVAEFKNQYNKRKKKNAHD